MLVALIATVLVIAVGAIAGIVIYKRLDTGAWQLPTGDDLVRIAAPRRPVTGPSKTIYLHRGPITLTGGTDAAHENRSSVIRSLGREQVVLAGFNSRNANRWGQIVSCVRDLFAPFDVAVTEERPAEPDYILVAVGGKPSDIGYDGNHVAGLSPFNGEVIPRAVVFAFSQRLGNRLRPTCETIGMEVAHVYGLDHSTECKDVMTYKSGCGRKKFIDKNVRCGEKADRDCANGSPTQNSYRELLDILGPRVE